MGMVFKNTFFFLNEELSRLPSPWTPLIFTRRLISSPRLREGSREGLGGRGEDGFGPETLIHCYLEDIFTLPAG